MIKSVTITNHLDESITLELMFPEKSGFVVQEITGLGPAKANINTTNLATTDGSIYNSSRLNERNIVLNLKLLGTPLIEDTRLLSYKYFPIQKRISIQIETDNRICSIYGYVESNEPTIFSNSETTQISILCPDPYFYSAGDDGTTTTILAGIESMFEFPFSIESEISVGEIIASRTQNIIYNGDSEVGISIYIHATGSVTDLSIYNLTTREVMKIDNTKLVTLTGSGIVAGDDIFISTVKGKKFINLLREGIFINIINCLGISTNWFTLSKGDNVFAFNASVGRTNIHCRIENQTVYEGV